MSVHCETCTDTPLPTTNTVLTAAITQPTRSLWQVYSPVICRRIIVLSIALIRVMNEHAWTTCLTQSTLVTCDIYTLYVHVHVDTLYNRIYGTAKWS